MAIIPAMDEFEDPNQPPEPTPSKQASTTDSSHIAARSSVFPASSTPAPLSYEPTQDERTFATLAHALQMPGWWIAPLIILITKKESRFVKFHATQALLLQCLHVMVTVTTMVVFFAVLIGSIAHAGSQNSGIEKMRPPVAMFAFMPIMWLAMFGMYVLVLALSIMYAIKAGKGEWANYPVIGSIARYMLNL